MGRFSDGEVNRRVIRDVRANGFMAVPLRFINDGRASAQMSGLNRRTDMRPERLAERDARDHRQVESDSAYCNGPIGCKIDAKNWLAGFGGTFRQTEL